jgi:hypothetical protein
MKTFAIPRCEGAKFQIGAQTFNVLNHQPVGKISNPQFGSSLLTVGFTHQHLRFVPRGRRLPARPAN